MRAKLTEATGHQIDAPADPFEAQGNRDALVELSGALKVVAVSLTKIAQDIALMGSGPRTGLVELALPELQKGSSIMPGKVNPVIPEVVLQVSAQVIGNDTAITIGGMQGQFELNVRVPLIARNLLHSITILSSASKMFAEKCIDGLEANVDVLETHAKSTPAIATALNPYIGYDKATEIVKEAVASKRTIREVAIEKGVDEETLDKALDLQRDGAAARPGHFVALAINAAAASSTPSGTCSRRRRLRAPLTVTSRPPGASSASRRRASCRLHRCQLLAPALVAVPMLLRELEPLRRSCGRA